jgi:hypothetical protein
MSQSENLTIQTPRHMIHLKYLPARTNSQTFQDSIVACYRDMTTRTRDRPLNFFVKTDLWNGAEVSFVRDHGQNSQTERDKGKNYARNMKATRPTDWIEWSGSRSESVSDSAKVGWNWWLRPRVWVWVWSNFRQVAMWAVCPARLTGPVAFANLDEAAALVVSIEDFVSCSQNPAVLNHREDRCYFCGCGISGAVAKWNCSLTIKWFIGTWVGEPPWRWGMRGLGRRR